MRLGIYYRVSTTKQDFESQKYVIKAHLEELPPRQRPRKIVEYSDHGISGVTRNRPGLVKLMRDAELKKIDCVLTYALDRVSRRTVDALQILLKLMELEVGFMSATQPWLNLTDAQPFRATILAMFADLAQLERDAIQRRVVAGLAAARERGVKLGRPRTLEEELYQAIALEHYCGKPMRAIAGLFGVSTTTVKRAVDGFWEQLDEETEGAYNQQKIEGAPDAL